MPPSIIKLVPIEQIRKGPAELGVRHLNLTRGWIFSVQEVEGLADGIEERHTVGNGQPPPAPSQYERGLQKPNIICEERQRKYERKSECFRVEED